MCFLRRSNVQFVSYAQGLLRSAILLVLFSAKIASEVCIRLMKWMHVIGFPCEDIFKPLECNVGPKNAKWE
jgi:hypothetical protein